MLPPKVRPCHRLIPFPRLQSSVTAPPSRPFTSSPPFQTAVASCLRLAAVSTHPKNAPYSRVRPCHRLIQSPRPEGLLRAPALQTLLSTKTGPEIPGSSNPVQLAHKPAESSIKTAIFPSLIWIPGVAYIRMYLPSKPAKKHPQSPCPTAAASPQPPLSTNKSFTVSPSLQTVTAMCRRLTAISAHSKNAPYPRAVEVYLKSTPPFFQSQTASATLVYPAAPSPAVIDSAASRTTRQSTPSMSP